MSFINSVSLSSTSFNFSNSFNFAGIQGVSNTTLLGMQGISSSFESSIGTFGGMSSLTLERVYLMLYLQISKMPLL